MKHTTFLAWTPEMELYRTHQGYGDGVERWHLYPEVRFEYCNSDRTTCPVCGGFIHTDIMDEVCIANMRHSDRPWPDILRSPEYVVWAVSDHVAADMKSAGISGCKFHPLKLRGVPRKYRPQTNYWLLERCSGKVLYNPILPEIYKKWRCPSCGRIDERGIRDKYGLNNLCFGEYNVDARTYNGGDWIDAMFDGYLRSAMCSRRIVELAHQKGWTNAFFSPPPRWCYYELSADYFASNWHDLLMYDIAKRDAELNLINPQNYGYLPAADSEIQRKIAELKARGETLVPTTRPKPIYDLHKPPVFNDTPAHPFDELSKFDGGGWQGSVECSALFGRDMFSITADERYTPHHTDGSHFDDSVLPTKNQRKLFDVFIANEQKILPELKKRLLAEIAREKPELSLPPADADFSALASLLKMPSLFIGEPIKRSKGIVELSYNLDNTNPIIDIVAAIECDLKTGDMRIASCETEESIRPNSPN